jgi:hypothetical protein
MILHGRADWHSEKVSVLFRMQEKAESEAWKPLL